MNIEVECVDDGKEGFFRVYWEGDTCFQAEELESALIDTFTFLGYNFNFKNLEEFGENV